MGVLYIVATPIGNLEDITLRALRILKQVDLILAENPNHSKKLLNHFGITTELSNTPYYDETELSSNLLQRLSEQAQIAFISDAGTPLISDPGLQLIRQAQSANISVVPIPGPSAPITALSVAGMASKQFVFEGFLPAKQPRRQERLQELAAEIRTLVFLEAPHRIEKSIQDLQLIFGSNRSMVLARELTKSYETLLRGTIAEVGNSIHQDGHQRKGEMVLVVAGHQPKAQQQVLLEEEIKLLRILLKELPQSKASAIAARFFKQPKQKYYQYLLHDDSNETC